jgi:hypothetical protein
MTAFARAGCATMAVETIETACRSRGLLRVDVTMTQGPFAIAGSVMDDYPMEKTVST